eukprot:gnl/TRDRNA2_/TRDRNA2_189449_c0_seq1.p1 gnl/TRDRNA2_/TRDRNA2_189449_c0~~gnl/TRDRNA2_/TRDRNA2_189449_c0_seq1.p1  ORF type:complete len:126 (+),score=13.74 gnl/TRDRNA2_/TRDRNA2_189449_c0_seq1:82-459(+)
MLVSRLLAFVVLCATLDLAVGRLFRSARSSELPGLASTGLEEDKLAEALKKGNPKLNRLNAEFLLGLLNQHQEWSPDEKLNVLRKYAESPTETSHEARYLLRHHVAEKSLSRQLAELMDSEDTHK